MCPEQTAKTKDSRIGGTIIVICTALTAIVTVIGVYLNYYYQKQENLIAVGTHVSFYVPENAKNSIYDEKNLLSSILIQKYTDKMGVMSRDSKEIFVSIIDIIDSREKVDKSQLALLKLLRSYRQIEITNVGEKEAENISIELDEASGSYRIGDAIDTENKEFRNSIPVGNLRPNISTKVFVWTSELQVYKWEKALVSYKNGSSKILFKQDLDLDEITWKWYDYLFFGVIALLVGGIIFGIGYAVGNKEWRAELAEEQEVLKEFRERKKAEKLKNNTTDVKENNTAITAVAERLPITHKEEKPEVDNQEQSLINTHTNATRRKALRDAKKKSNADLNDSDPN